MGFLAGYQQLVVIDKGTEISYIHLQENQVIADLLSHDSLTIVGNSELSATAQSESWSGNGTSSNPFVIEGYSFFNDIISMSHTTFLSISNTSYYVTIRNCSFAYGRQFNYVEGISLENVTNTIIMNCSFDYLENGITIQRSSSCTVRNITCTNLRHNGIYFLECQDILVEDNTIIGVRYGVSINYALDFSTIRNNTLINSSITFGGDNPSHFIQNATGNTVNELPFGYFTNISDTTIDMTGYGSLFLANCSDIKANNGYFVNSSIGVTLAFCRDSSIINFTSRYGSIGVFNTFCTNCTLINSKFIDNEYSIQIEYSENCRVQKNSIYGNEYSAIGLHEVQGIDVSENNMSAADGNVGIYGSFCNDSIFNKNKITGYLMGNAIYDTLNCNVTQNSIDDSLWYGYYSKRSENNYIFNNSIRFNDIYGIVLSNPVGDEISHNVLIDNANGASITNSSGCIFRNNSVSNNRHAGLKFYNSSDCTIINNTITHNGETISPYHQSGIYLSSNVSNFEIYGNIIGWNDDSNARDDGSSNIWDDGFSRGNIWSDYTTPPYYEIPGTAGSYDRYPSVIVDVYAPLITTEYSPTNPTSEEIVTVTAVVFDHSELAEVILSFSIDSGVHWNNITMEQKADEWTAEIPLNSETALVQYKVYATDILGHGAVSDTESFTVIILQPTTTTNTTTSVTSTSTSPSTSTTESDYGVTLFVEIGAFIGCGIIVILLIKFVTRGSTGPK